jgi:hypothetical protein
MNNKKLFIVIIALTAYKNTQTFFDAIAGKGAFEAGKIAINYYYNNEKEKKTLKRNLTNKKPTIEHECIDNFTANCAQLANHFKKAEEYYRFNILKQQLEIIEEPCLQKIIEEDYQEALGEKKKGDLSLYNKSYFESLSSNEQNELKELMKNLIKEHNCEKNYAEELNKIYMALNR